MVIGEPERLLIVEFHGLEDQVLFTQLAQLETLMGDLGFPILHIGKEVRVSGSIAQAYGDISRTGGLK